MKCATVSKIENNLKLLKHLPLEFERKRKHHNHTTLADKRAGEVNGTCTSPMDTSRMMMDNKLVKVLRRRRSFREISRFSHKIFDGSICE
jgi:hypothetical protein